MVTEIKWSLPAGHSVGAEPKTLDAALVGEMVYLRWKDYGWQLGKIYAQVTSDTPHLFKQFNYRVVWGDGSRGPAKLEVNTYLSGPDAPLDSWVILKRTDQ